MLNLPSRPLSVGPKRSADGWDENEAMRQDEAG